MNIFHFLSRKTPPSPSEEVAEDLGDQIERLWEDAPEGVSKFKKPYPLSILSWFD